MVAFGKLFDISDYATKGLQKKDMDITQAIDLIETLKETLLNYRKDTDNEFEKIKKLTEEMAEKNTIDRFDTCSGRKRQISSRLNKSVVTLSLANRAPITSYDDLRHIWFESLDCQLMELNKRFSKDVYCLMKAASSFIPTHSGFNFETIQELTSSVLKMYNKPPVPISELEFFVKFISQKKIHNSLIELLDDVDEDIFPNVRNVLKLLVTLPVSSCSVERLFSTVKRVKTAQRASMLTSRLNHLSLISFERELVNSINYDEIIDSFNAHQNRRLILKM